LPELADWNARSVRNELRNRVRRFGVSQFIVTTKSEKTIRALAEKVFPALTKLIRPPE
jgi:hypothetical protein